jgi:tetrahydromethanopterin S-methyltransferase subunit G
VFKQLLIGSSVLAFLLTGSLSAQAQAPKPTAPSSQPQTAPQTQISSAELEKFARSLKQLLAIEQGANQQIVQAIGQSGLSQQRFVELYKAQRNPSNQPTQKVTPQEKQQFDKALTSLSDIQQKAETQMKEVLQKEGLQIERFNQIEAQVRQDTQLQQKVRQMIQG